MAKDLTIRILGRPQVTKDDAVGYQRISRQYVVEGYRASYAGINDNSNPLFLAVGTEDEEFEGHYLVDQKISPKQGSVDTAYLTREFVEIRPTWSSEQFSHSNGFQRCSRTFVALRAVNSLGYSADNFQYHPAVSPQKDENPWKYAPSVVLNSEPTLSEEFDIPKGINFNQKWSRVSISVDTKSPGIDIWNVSWVSPIRPEGEPTITKDTAIGYETVSRSYAISAEYYNKNKIFDSSNPLFLEVGEADHEYGDHYLVNQQIKPLLNAQKGADEVEDLAVLTREFVQLRDTWVSENFSQSRGFKKITRTFVALRAVHSLGYTAQKFQYHPTVNPQKEYDPSKYLPRVVSNSTPTNAEAFNFPVGVSFNHIWARSSIAVDTKSPGVDVWSVTWVAPVRPEGEPTISKDSLLGFQRVVRAYAISGDFYNKNSIFNSANPLFLPVGTSDHEYSNHYLVNQQIKPMLNLQKESTGDDIDDLAILTREFVEIRDTHISESVSTTSDLRKLRRQYVVLRGLSPSGTSVGYSSDNFEKHPYNVSKSQPSGYAPWDYIPEQISNPGELSYSASEFQVAGKVPTLSNVEDDNTSYPSAITTYSGFNEFNNGNWLRGTAQVDLSKPGVDVWSVDWVTHVNSYQTSTAKKTGGSFKVPNVVELDEHGVRLNDFGGSGSSSGISDVVSHVAFFVADTVPPGVSSYWGGGSNYTPSVMFDFFFIRHDGQRITMNKLFKNTVYQKSVRHIEFPTGKGSKHKIGDKSGYQITMTGDYKDLAKYDYTESKVIKKDESGNDVYEDTTITRYDKTENLPLYQRKPIVFAGGKITFTASIASSSNNNASLIGVTVTPIFTSSDKNESKRIWKVVTTYAG